MNIKFRPKLIVISVIFFMVLSFSLSTKLSADDHDKVRDLVKSGNILSLETILDRLKAKSPGRVLEVELEHKKGRLIYEIEQIDEQGVVKEYSFDATNGELIKEKVEH